MSEDVWILKIYEPFSIECRAFIKPADGRPLGVVLEEYEMDGFAVSYVIIDNHEPSLHWKAIIPEKGQTIAIFPKVGVKTFSNAFVEELNKDHSAGIFVQAVELAIPGDTQRFVAWEQPVTWQGNTYTPLHMEWSGLESDRGMQIPQMSVVVPSMHGQVMEWVEDVDIRELDVTFRLLHLDHLADASSQDSFALQVQTVTGDDQVVVINCSLTISLEDHLPRGAIMKSEFPGIPENASKILI